MRALVTGGGGFLGQAIVRQLVARGDEVVCFSRGDYPELRRLGVQTLRGDVADVVAVAAAVRGCDVVFHVAARAGIWGSWDEFRSANIEGTANVLTACHQHGVRRLVYTSSPSVVHAGTDLAGVDESAPYASVHSDAYPATKIVAERMVLSASTAELATVALRPHLIWGPGDTQLTARILDRARRGRLRLVGDGQALMDTTYITNAAEAHLLAADRLAPDAACAGRPYFISQGEPLPVAKMINRILDAAGLPPVTASVPPRVAYVAGAGAELAWRLARRSDEPPITRFLARQLSTAHWFDISAARRDLGYGPRISLDEGMAQLKACLQSAGRSLPQP
ncbi:MAG: NAD-dependent epimerase/dehydratase family protein [Actinomycetota bacterium]|nr:NAD-dependent epimerase/dehydratase family protein [Actinomycetota bacterium]